MRVKERFNELVEGPQKTRSKAHGVNPPHILPEVKLKNPGAIAILDLTQHPN
jgi:hypothetical protein